MLRITHQPDPRCMRVHDRQTNPYPSLRDLNKLTDQLEITQKSLAMLYGVSVCKRLRCMCSAGRRYNLFQCSYSFLCSSVLRIRRKSKERGYSIFSNHFAVLSGALRDSLLVSSSSSVAPGGWCSYLIFPSFPTLHTASPYCVQGA